MYGARRGICFSQDSELRGGNQPGAGSLRRRFFETLVKWKAVQNNLENHGSKC